MTSHLVEKFYLCILGHSVNTACIISPLLGQYCLTGLELDTGVEDKAEELGIRMGGRGICGGRFLVAVLWGGCLLGSADLAGVMHSWEVFLGRRTGCVIPPVTARVGDSELELLYLVLVEVGAPVSGEMEDSSWHAH